MPVFYVGRIKLLCLRNRHILVLLLVCLSVPGICVSMSCFQSCPTCKRKLWFKPEQVTDIWSHRLGKLHWNIAVDP